MEPYSVHVEKDAEGGLVISLDNRASRQLHLVLNGIGRGHKSMDDLNTAIEALLIGSPGAAAKYRKLATDVAATKPPTTAPAPAELRAKRRRQYAEDQMKEGPDA